MSFFFLFFFFFSFLSALYLLLVTAVWSKSPLRKDLRTGVNNYGINFLCQYSSDVIVDVCSGGNGGWLNLAPVDDAYDGGRGHQNNILVKPPLFT